MNTVNDRERNTAKMHKLRRALDRLRSIRSRGEPTVQRKPWLERLKRRLGLRTDSN